LPNPRGGALSQFRVILRLPCSGSFAQHFALPPELDFAWGDFGEESTPAPFAGEFVDVGDQIYLID
jgi:hypothetical protein